MDPLDLAAEIAVLREQLATIIHIQKDSEKPLSTEQIITYVTMCTREIMRGVGKQVAIQSAGGAGRLEAALELISADIRSIMLTDDSA